MLGYKKLTDPEQDYIRIYHCYFVLKWSWSEIADHFECSKMTIRNAIKWVVDNKMTFPAKYLMDGAIDAINYRLKENLKHLEKEYTKTKYKDKNFIIALNREIREDEATIYKLQSLAEDDSNEDDNIKPSDVLKLIKAASKESEKEAT